MISSLTVAILNADKNSPDINGKIYAPWENRYSATMADFYTDFIVDRLPDPTVVKKWHDMLVEYSKMPGAIFPVRAGNTSKKLRRGWLVKVDDGFSYMFSDNGFASYIYKMVLDGYCPLATEFYKFMTEFVRPDQIEWLEEINKNPKKKKAATINNTLDQTGVLERRFSRMPVHFHQIGGSGVDKSEDEKNVYINTAPAPVCCLGEYNYKHAHLIGVAENDYEMPGGVVYEFKIIKTLLLGEDADYAWDSTVGNYVWNRKIADYKGEVPFATIEKIVIAQFFRFLDPINHFLAPKEQQNKFTRADGFFDMDIAEYENLLKYLIGEKEKVFNSDKTGEGKLTYFDDFREKTYAPRAMFGVDTISAGTEPIQVVYHEKSLSQSLYGDKVGGTTKKPTTTSRKKTSTGSAPVKTTTAAVDLTKISYSYLNDNFKVGVIAQEVLGAILRSGRVSKSDVDGFKTEAVTKKTFGFGKPLLSPVMVRTSNSNRYYADTYTLYGEKLFLYSQWQEAHKERLIQWILNWIAANGGKI
jgi:hypothetical protein